MSKRNLIVLLDWFLTLLAVFIAMIAVGTFAMPFAAILYAIGLPVFLCQIGGIIMSGGFFWLMIEAYISQA